MEWTDMGFPFCLIIQKAPGLPSCPSTIGNQHRTDWLALGRGIGDYIKTIPGHFPWETIAYPNISIEFTEFNEVIFTSELSIVCQDISFRNKCLASATSSDKRTFMSLSTGVGGKFLINTAL